MGGRLTATASGFISADPAAIWAVITVPQQFSGTCRPGGCRRRPRCIVPRAGRPAGHDQARNQHPSFIEPRRGDSDGLDV